MILTALQACIGGGKGVFGGEGGEGGGRVGGFILEKISNKYDSYSFVGL